MERVKEGLGKAGKAINPNFKGVIGERVRCTYRKYGKKYNYDRAKKDSLKPFLVAKEWFDLDSDKVDNYVKEVGELPEGVYMPEREPKLTITIREE